MKFFRRFNLDFDKQSKLVMWQVFLALLELIGLGAVYFYFLFGQIDKSLLFGGSAFIALTLVTINTWFANWLCKEKKRKQKQRK